LKFLEKRSQRVYTKTLSIKRLFLLFTILCFGLLPFKQVFSQQYNNWLFGIEAYLTFNPGITPVPHSVSGSAMSANEGTCSISDENGSLLFYTNGQTVYNKNHQVMVNGTDLGGHPSAAQIVAVPMPGNDSLYYIFTTDALENNLNDGYHYSVVNMKKANGLGAVILKKQPLFASCSERITATYHANGLDIWIITNDKNSNIFRSWLLTCNGLQSTPVVSVVGEVLSDDLMNVGSMKVSPNGEKLCQTHYTDLPIINQDSYFQLFDFNNATGALSNAQQIYVPNLNVNNCEFSPNSKLLYLCEPTMDRIEQVEVDLPSAIAIALSHVSIPAKKMIYAMQCGPDNKLYINSLGTELSVIEAPNVKGLGCRFVADKISLGKPGRAGFSFVLKPLILDTDRFGYTTTDGCIGTVQFSAPQNTWGTVSWLWDFGDGTTSTLENPVHTFTPASQIYQVKLKISSPALCGSILKSLLVAPQGSIAKADFNFVMKCDSLTVRFSNSSVYSDSIKYEWFFGDGNMSIAENPTHIYSTQQQFNVKLRIQNTAGTCYLDSIAKSVNLEPFQISVPAGRTIEEGEWVQLDVDKGNKFKWSPSTWLNNDTLKSPVARPLDDIIYTVTSTNEIGCTAKDSIRILVKQFAEIYVPSAFTPNGDSRNAFFYPFVGGRFALENFSVFTRWGQAIFSTKEKLRGWDGTWKGKQMPAGVYVWVVKAKDKSGHSIIKKGTVVLLR